MFSNRPSWGVTHGGTISGSFCTNRINFKPDLPGTIRAVTDACTRAIQRLNSKITQNEIVTSHYIVKSNISQTSHVSVLPGGGVYCFGGGLLFTSRGYCVSLRHSDPDM